MERKGNEIKEHRRFASRFFCAPRFPTSGLYTHSPRASTSGTGNNSNSPTKFSFNRRAAATYPYIQSTPSSLSVAFSSSSISKTCQTHARGTSPRGLSDRTKKQIEEGSMNIGKLSRKHQDLYVNLCIPLQKPNTRSEAVDKMLLLLPGDILRRKAIGVINLLSAGDT